MLTSHNAIEKITAIKLLLRLEILEIFCQLSSIIFWNLSRFCKLRLTVTLIFREWIPLLFDDYHYRMKTYLIYSLISGVIYLQVFNKCCHCNYIWLIYSRLEWRDLTNSFWSSHMSVWLIVINRVICLGYGSNIPGFGFN